MGYFNFVVVMPVAGVIFTLCSPNTRVMPWAKLVGNRAHTSLSSVVEGSEDSEGDKLCF